MACCLVKHRYSFICFNRLSFVDAIDCVKLGDECSMHTSYVRYNVTSGAAVTQASRLHMSKCDPGTEVHVIWLDVSVCREILFCTFHEGYCIDCFYSDVHVTCSWPSLGPDHWTVLLLSGLPTASVLLFCMAEWFTVLLRLALSCSHDNSVELRKSKAIPVTGHGGL
jgi:hypothetical protein